MNDSNDELRELEEVADRLRRERPQVSELELDQIKVRAMRRAPADRSSTKGRLMYSRLVTTTMLVVGMLMALSGVGVANGVFDGDDSASVAQYGDAGDEGATVGGGEGARRPRSTRARVNGRSIVRSTPWRGRTRSGSALKWP